MKKIITTALIAATLTLGATTASSKPTIDKIIHLACKQPIAFYGAYDIRLELMSDRSVIVSMKGGTFNDKPQLAARGETSGITWENKAGWLGIKLDNHLSDIGIHTYRKSGGESKTGYCLVDPLKGGKT